MSSGRPIPAPPGGQGAPPSTGQGEGNRKPWKLLGGKNPPTEWPSRSQMVAGGTLLVAIALALTIMSGHASAFELGADQGLDPQP